MFTEFLQRLTGTAKAADKVLPPLDSRLALAALLVRMAKSDHSYQASEIGRIDKFLSAHFGLNPVEAAKLRATAEKLEHQAPETEVFTGLIRDAVSYNERVEVLDALWQVVMADGEEKPEEAEMIGFAAGALGVAEADAAALEARYLG
ncbi:TerB family tellurite resistance protein [Vannielia litorea]|uniref:tellurite resistance TerB family protein n=1 Tax=Vannielia litorea TaxID=1217970 RepID=UPI001BCB2202|nr:TerB family tellurite resistance protein [Vannielia litorea]MBS8225010.1 TerB family tellurite resistance protein [Vannielia litorea]